MTEEQKRKKREYNKRYRERNRERLKLYARQFRKDGRATRDLNKQKESIAKWEKKYPERRKAHREVYKAVRNGTLQKKPCKVCGSKEVQAHHEDYNYPLQVIWLCHIHHYEADLELERRNLNEK